MKHQWVLDCGGFINNITHGRQMDIELPVNSVYPADMNSVQFSSENVL